MNILKKLLHSEPVRSFAAFEAASKVIIGLLVGMKVITADQGLAVLGAETTIAAAVATILVRNAVTPFPPVPDSPANIAPPAK